MKILTYNFYNEVAKTEIKLNDFIRKRFEQTESIFKYFNELNNTDLERYISAFQNRLKTEIGDFYMDTDLVDQKNIKKDLEILNRYSELENEMILFICRLLEIPKEFEMFDNEIQVKYFNVRRSQSHLSYYRVKAIEDVLGKSKATRLYKKIVESQLKDQKAQDNNEKPEDPYKVTRLESREFILKHYKDFGVANFTLGIYDDFKEIYRSNK